MAPVGHAAVFTRSSCGARLSKRLATLAPGNQTQECKVGGGSRKEEKKQGAGSSEKGGMPFPNHSLWNHALPGGRSSYRWEGLTASRSRPAISQPVTSGGACGVPSCKMLELPTQGK